MTEFAYDANAPYEKRWFGVSNVRNAGKRYISLCDAQSQDVTTKWFIFGNEVPVPTRHTNSFGKGRAADADQCSIDVWTLGRLEIDWVSDTSDSGLYGRNIFANRDFVIRLGDRLFTVVGSGQ